MTCGKDPLACIHALSSLGDCDTRCDTGKLPTLEKLATDTFYLSWSITLTTEVEASEISSLFKPLDDFCNVQISVCSSGTQQQTDGVPPSANDAPQQQPKRAAQSADVQVVRVEVERIDRLVNLVGELAINQAMLTESMKDAGLSPHSNAMREFEEFQRLTRDIQDCVMMIRAQPIKSLFQRMSRIVREASASVGKDVRLVIEGETTEVDKTVIERLAEPLTHMIRNAVDHGLEDAETRMANGKPSQGHVRLKASHKSGRVIIIVSDDGQGIDRNKVLRIALERGWVPKDTTLTDAEIDNL